MENIRDEKEEMQFVELFRICLDEFRRHWKWFIVSVILCLAIGFYYQQRQSRVYQRQAVMLIEDADATGQMSPRKAKGNMSTLLELNGISVGDNLKNELFILTSFRLMERVVDSLRLDIDYTIQQDLHTVALYRDRPFETVFEGECRFPVSFAVTTAADGSFTLTDFRVKGRDRAGSFTVKSGTPVNTPAGRITLRAGHLAADFPHDEKVTVSRLPRKTAAALYLKNFAATEYDKDCSLIILSCADINADRAEDIIYEMFATYKRDVVENKNRVANNTARFIDERIRLIGDELSQVENRLADFKRTNRLVDFEENARLYLAEGSAARQRTLEMETQLSVARYLVDFLQDRSNGHELVPSLSLNGAEFGTQVSEYNRQMNERNRMVANSGENTPAVREMDRTLTAMRTALLGSVASYVSSTQLRLNKARTNERDISGKVGSVPEKEKEGLDIKRQQELKSALYTYLLNKREEVALQTAINEANVRMVEMPIGNTAPVSPRRAIILAVSLLLGLAIPSIIIWIRRLLDITISSRKDIETATSIPVVGEIPHQDEKTAQSIISSLPGDLPIVEAFRVLRYGLNFMRHSAKVFVTTSATQGQGKTYVSTNLAAILGMADKHVLLIDADIRRRTLSRKLGMTPGLTALLIDEEGQYSPDDLIIKHAIGDNIDFLPAGKIPPNPSELLMTDRLDDIIDAAGHRYDYIVIDTTPTLAVADAGIINRVADLTLFVMRVGVQERQFLPEIEKMYQAKKFRNLCVVINDADVKGGSYGYGYGYGYTERKPRRGFLRRK